MVTSYFVEYFTKSSERKVGNVPTFLLHEKNVVSRYVLHFVVGCNFLFCSHARFAIYHMSQNIDFHLTRNRHMLIP